MERTPDKAVPKIGHKDGFRTIKRENTNENAGMFPWEKRGLKPRLRVGKHIGNRTFLEQICREKVVIGENNKHQINTKTPFFKGLI